MLSSNSTKRRQAILCGVLILICFIILLSMSSNADGFNFIIIGTSLTASNSVLYDIIFNKTFFGNGMVLSLADVIIPKVPSEPAIIL